jgi:hypothetical protein
MQRLLTALLTISLGASIVFAADKATATPENKGRFSIATATCGDVFNLYEDASPGEGKDPKALEDAQDTVLDFVLWVHGYLSGRDGINRDRRPLSKEGVELTVKQIADVCKPDESRLFLDVVDGIK